MNNISYYKLKQIGYSLGRYSELSKIWWVSFTMELNADVKLFRMDSHGKNFILHPHDVQHYN